MTDYTQTTTFAPKDALPNLDPDKVLRGGEFDTEFSNIATAVNSKVEKSNGTHTGTTTVADLNVTTNVDAATLTTTGLATVNDLNVTTNVDAATLTTTGLATVNDLNVTTNIDTATLTATGVVDAASFTGDGSALTGIADNGHVIEQNTSALTARSALNFSTSFNATDNAGTDATDVALSSSVLATLAAADAVDLSDVVVNTDEMDTPAAETDRITNLQVCTFAEYIAQGSASGYDDNTLYIIIG